MPLSEESLRVAIAGAASLRGQDLKIFLEESGFPAGEVRLFDEEPLAGTLTELGGEAALIHGIGEDSFHGLRFVFFAGTRAFARLHAPAALRAGATVIDLTGELADMPGAAAWIPRVDGVLAPPSKSRAMEGARVFLAPSTPAIVAISLCAALGPLGAKRVVLNLLASASERGKEGVEELSEQTIKLLSLQPIPQDVFDCQVAFNMVDRWGAESREDLPKQREAIAREVRVYLDGRAALPAISLTQAPVFYGHAFTAFMEFELGTGAAALGKRLAAAGFEQITEDDPPPSNASVAGTAKAAVTDAVADCSVANGYWIWGAADNYRLAVSNATQIAEKLLVA